MQVIDLRQDNRPTVKDIPAVSHLVEDPEKYVETGCHRARPYRKDNQGFI